jgi:hypothetical protein
MKQKIKEKIAEHLPEDGCHHYWVIEVANGPTSSGRCKYCGETKEFYNAFPDFNPLRRGNNPLELPKIHNVEVDEESKS